MDSCECLFNNKENKFDVVILVYVDALMILSADIDGLGCMNNMLKSLLKLMNLVELKYYLSVLFELKGATCS